MHNSKIIVIGLIIIGMALIFAPNELSKSRSYDECLGFRLNLVCFGLADDGSTSALQRKINFLKSPNKFCGTAGMATPTIARKCCEGLSEMWNTCAEDDCACQHSFSALGGLGVCSDCGNSICDRNNNENYCNCPNDCKSLK